MSSPAYEQHVRRVQRVEEVGGTLKALFPFGQQQLGRYLADEVEGGITVLSLVKLAAFLGGGAESEAAAFVGERLRLGRRACRMLERLLSYERIVSETQGGRLTTRAQYRFFKDHEPAGPGLLLLALAGEAATRQLCTKLLGFYCNEYDAVKDEQLLSGQEIMHILGVGQGPVVGYAVERLKDAERKGLVNDKRDAGLFLKKNLLTKEASIS